MDDELLKAKKELETLNRQLATALTVNINLHREKIEDKMAQMEVTFGARVDKEVALHFDAILRKITDLMRRVTDYQQATDRTITQLRTEFRDKAGTLDRLTKEIKTAQHKAAK